MWPVNTQLMLAVMQGMMDFIADIPGNFESSEPIVVLRHNFPQSQIDAANDLANDLFPKDFRFGVATAAYQIEGAWNEDGKGQSAWDYYTHEKPELIEDRSNADIAADSYHKYKEDVQLMKSIGVNTYRFSISWTRLLPSGTPNKINPAGVEYYNNLINELLANGITPMVTLFHWDMPFGMQQEGGMTNSRVIEWMKYYAKIVFALYGDRVKHWITINEPHVLCVFGYGGNNTIPLIDVPGIAEYLCGHNALLAHATIYEMYNRDFRWKQNGKVGITLDVGWPVPASESVEDVEAAERVYQWSNGWFFHPLFTEEGDYPPIMIERITRKSFAQGFTFRRLPIFSAKQIRMIRGAADFLGINYYTAQMVRSHEVENNMPSLTRDAGYEIASKPSSWKGELWVKNTPWAFRALLHRLNNDYILPEIYVTENGYADSGQMDDMDRAVYIHQHLFEVLRALKNGVDLRGYMAWSLIDNFEWLHGYTVKFGFFHVDFNDPNRPRTPKLSSIVANDIYRNRRIIPIADVLNSTTVTVKSPQVMPIEVEKIMIVKEIVSVID